MNLRISVPIRLFEDFLPLDRILGIWEPVCSSLRRTPSDIVNSMKPSLKRASANPMQEFVPPQHNKLVLSAAKLLLPLHLSQEKLTMRPSANCINAIRRQLGQSTVLMLNHSDRSDPSAAFALSVAVGEPFYYLSARELFDMNSGFRGFIMQRCGAYSVKRGNPEDFESKEKTISLIIEGRHPLVMFPEGDVTGRDDEILPLKVDGLKNILEAQTVMSALETPRSVTLLPIAIYFEAQDDSIMDLQNCLARLERKLELVAREYALQPRITRILLEVISHLESYYSIHDMKDSSLQYRLQNICRRASMAIAQYAQLVEINPNEDEHVLLYNVRSGLRGRASLDHTYGCSFCDKLNEDRLTKGKSCETELDFLQQLLIIASTLDERLFSVDQAWRLIDRLEHIVFGKATAKGNRIAWMEAGDPLALDAYIPEYEASPEKTIQRIDRQVRNSLSSNLLRLKRIANIVQSR